MGSIRIVPMFASALGDAVLQLIGCLFGRHRPDREQLRGYRGAFFGPCKGCQRRMYRSTNGWRLAKPGDSIRPADGYSEGRRRGDHTADAHGGLSAE
jgi:hypothetical protein